MRAKWAVPDMSSGMAHPWHDLPNNPDTAAESLNVVIEIPMGSMVKYELDKVTGTLRVNRMLYSSVHYPANYGFIPRTYADDGDPLDVLVLGTEPVHPLSILCARPIGVMRMEEDGLVDDKIIAVHLHDPAFAECRDVEQLPRHTSAQIQRFFEDYKILEDKIVRVDHLGGAEDALEAVLHALALYRTEEQRLRGW